MAMMFGNIASISFLLLLSSISTAQSSVFDVTTYGAKPNADITQALANAWKDACASPTPSKLYIPAGTYKLVQANLQGPCKAPIQFQLQGTLQAQTGTQSNKVGDGWVTIERIDKLTLFGGGVFDGQGTDTWGKNCAKQNYCGKQPINIRFNFVTNSLVQGVTSLDSKQFHVNVLGCSNLTFDHFTITAPAESLNTDGIHIGRSVGINITNSNIRTGDDCISLGDGSKEIRITGVNCGPGHGISVGSLGKYPNEEPVQGVFVKNCTLTGTQNGVRIKTWPDSHQGAASDMHFEDIIMNNVGFPVLIDQEYCPWNQCKQSIPSRIQLSKVSFTKIRGTSSTVEAVKLVCSRGVPCQNVEISDINLKYTGPQGPAKSICKNVRPTIRGQQVPAACTATA